MKNINLSSRTNKDWSGEFMLEDHYDVLLNENTTVFDEKGQLLAVLLKGGIKGPDFERFLSVMKTQTWSTNNRGTAAGSGTTRRIKLDGTVSKTTIGAIVESGIFGFFERNPRFPYCRACAFNLKHPELFKHTLPKLQKVSELFRQYVPDRFTYQDEYVKRTNPDFVIPGTVYTTVTVNRNFRTAAHQDAGDLEFGFSAMSVATEGRFAGGNLVFPDFRIAVKLEHGDLIFFQPHEFHGNTPIIPLSKNYARWSFVHYYRTKMEHCLSNAEELKRAQTREVGSSLF